MITFHDLYEAYAKDVYRFAFWLSGSAVEADDITSETFVLAWARFDNGRATTAKAYLFTIARNIYLKQQQQRKRLTVLSETQIDQHPTPGELTASRETLQLVIDLLQTLKETDRSAFIMRVQDELPYADIARLLGLSETAVKVKVHRVRLKLAERRLAEEAL
jgi:RNA polymerase sigma-70 factor, ECF subfamily